MTRQRGALWLQVLALLPLAALLAAEERARLLIPVLLAIAGLLASRLGRLPLSRRGWDLMSVLALTFFLVELFVLGESSLFAAVHLLLYLLVNRAHHMETARDGEQLLLVSLLLMLAVSVLSVVAMVLPFFLAYLVVGLGSLETLHRRREREGRDTDAVVAAPGSAGPRPLRAAGAILLLAVALFIVFPRVGQGTYQSRILRPQHVSGFSAEVELDDIGRIKENDERVGRVRPLSEGGRRLGLLRAVAFRDFDGHRWRRDGATGGLLPREARTDRWRVQRPRRRAQLEWFEITLEPLRPAIVLTPERPTYLRGGALMLARMDRAGSVTLPERGRNRTRIHYEAAAELARPPVESLASSEPEPPEVNGYRQLPELDPRIGALSARLAPADSPRRTVVEGIERYLKRGYRYSLSPAGGADPLANFLFEVRAGHCELFASAMAVLLRSRDIPARVVNGFRVTEWNDIGEYFLIRQSDAHAWVEVFYPGAGWVAYDPTPPDPERQRWALGLRLVSHLTDVLLFQWDRYVISWSYTDQLLAIADLRDAIAAMPTRLGAALRTRRDAWLVLAPAVLLVALYLMRRRRSGQGSRDGEAVRLYRELRSALHRSGMPVSGSEGPVALARRVVDLPGAERILTLYVNDRFGGAPGEPGAVASARAALKQIRRELSRSK